MSRGTKVRSSCWLQQSENALQYLDGPTSLRLARPFGIRVVDGFQFFDWAGLRSGGERKEYGRRHPPTTWARKRRAAPPTTTVYLTIACSVRRFEVGVSFSTSLVFFLFFYLRARLNFPLIYTVEPGERAQGGAGWRILLRFPKGKIQFLCWSAGLKKNCYWSGISGLTVFCLMGDIFLEKHSWFPRSLQSWPASGK